ACDGGGRSSGHARCLGSRRIVVVEDACTSKFGSIAEPGSHPAHHGTTVQCKTAKELMSEMGQKRTWRGEFAMSALPPKADIAGRRLDVRFVPESDICSAAKQRAIRSPRRRGRATSAAHRYPSPSRPWR